jgi:hypothetical protein
MKPREHVRSVPTDVSQFSGLQLHPRALIALALSAYAGWLKTHAISHRDLLRKHRIGFVFWGVDLAWQAPLGYLDADELEIRSEARVRRAGAQLELVATVFANGEPVAVVRSCSVPLWIAEEDELSGLPAPIGPALLEKFVDEEIDDTPYVTPVPELLARIEGGALLCQREEALFFHRQHCEFADQWYFGVTPDLAAVGRERLALVHGDEVPLLRKGLSLPLRHLHMHFTKPYSLFDAGKLETRAYRTEEGIAFVHRLIGERDDLHATAIELF